jgi:hypothetical protein
MVRSERGRKDRRLSCRFPIEAEVRYLLLQGKAIQETGRGRTVNISSSGILFESAHSIPPGIPIELSIAWPARIDGIVRMRLRASGRTVRNQDNCTAVKIRRYEFRTAGIRERAVESVLEMPA